MANVGDTIQTPEIGYKRFNCMNSNISYIGTFTNDSDSNNLKYTEKLNDQVVFYFYGTKLLILDNKTTNRSNNIKIDIDGVVDTYNNRGTTTSNYNTCVYMKDGLERKVHKVIITNASTDTIRRMGLQNIDIDEDGYMVYCDTNGKLYYDVTPIMTSNNTPSPYIANTNSYESYRFDAYKAFDDSITTAWTTNDYVDIGWLSIGNTRDKIRISSIGILAPYNFSSVNALTCAFRNFKIEGSNDNSKWEFIKEFNTGDYEKDVMKIFNFNQLKSYNYFRIYEENKDKGVRKYICASEIKLLIDVNLPFYLIQDNDNGKIYNYNKENNQLVEVTDFSILNEATMNNTCIDDLNKVLPLLSTLSNNLTLLSNQNNVVNISGIKRDKTKSMICTLEPISMNKFATIHSITGDYTIKNDSDIRFIFSFDKGATWKTYDISSSAWNDVNVNIPIKLYENFSDTDKTNWNTARDTILSEGISVQDLGNVDFQSVKINKLMFAVAFNRTAYSNTCTLKGLNINYDGLETYTQLGCGSNLSSYEAKVTITGDEVGVTTSSNQDKILVTMTTNI